MKVNKLFITVVILLLSTGVYSQEKKKKDTVQTTPEVKTTNDDFRRFRIVVFGNTGLSWMSPKNKEYTKKGPRFVAGWGLMLDWNFTETYTFSSGFSIGGYGGNLQFGHTRKLNDTIPVNGVMDRKYKIKYLTIPLNLKLKTNQIGYFTYFFQIGLNNHFRLSAYADDEFTSSTADKSSYSEDDVDIISNTTLYGLSFIVGAGAEYQISKSLSAFGSLTYDNGMLNALTGTNTLDPSVKENAIVNRFALTVGFLF